MKVSEVVEKRTPQWKELEADIKWAQTKRRKDWEPQQIADFVRRYRATCSDLALATSMKFPATTVRYLHQLVADAHTQIYRSESFRFRDWARTLFVEVPRRILADPCTWISFFMFWSLFLGSMLAAAIRPDFGSQIVGEAALSEYEAMYAKPMDAKAYDDSRSFMTGFYLFHNAGIGLRCFASGIFFGVGSLVTLAFNAILLGAVFGHMLMSSAGGNFATFVTAHGPFELTAVVLSGAAGLRMGWALIDTQGFNRMESLRRTGSRALEIAGLATILFLLAAYIEGFISPSGLPYSVKAGVALTSSLLLIGYVVGLGSPLWQRRRHAA